VRRLLLDTHVALWAFSAPKTLAPGIRELLVDPRTTVAVSAASIWEVAIKRAIGKLTAPPGFAAMCIERGFDPLAITFEHAEQAGALPQHHADPFDRMLVAQARVEDLELVSNDQVFQHYNVRWLAAT
jgi:PIN domain nuclease of toxin-antitoxin system